MRTESQVGTSSQSIQALSNSIVDCNQKIEHEVHATRVYPTDYISISFATFGFAIELLMIYLRYIHSEYIDGLRESPNNTELLLIGHLAAFFLPAWLIIAALQPRATKHHVGDLSPELQNQLQTIVTNSNSLNIMNVNITAESKITKATGKLYQIRNAAEKIDKTKYDYAIRLFDQNQMMNQKINQLQQEIQALKETGLDP